MTVKLGVAALLSATILSLGAASFARAEDAPTQRVSRSEIWHNGPIKFVDTMPFKKAPPYTIGFSNASISARFSGAMTLCQSSHLCQPSGMLSASSISMIPVRSQCRRHQAAECRHESSWVHHA